MIQNYIENANFEDTPFHIGAGNVERSVLRSLYDHLIQDVERLTEFLLFLFQSS